MSGTPSSSALALNLFRTMSFASSTSSQKAKPIDKALLIGITYHDNEIWDTLPDPLPDVLNLKSLLIDVYDYEEKNIVVLLDDGENRATRANILHTMRKFMIGVKAGDRLFFHYSGHGDQVDCQPGDTSEPDLKDEAIIPCDATDDPKTWIIDNLLNDMLVKTLPVDATLFAVFDACHSGTALDLKHYDNHIYVPRVTNFVRRVVGLPRYGLTRRNALLHEASVVSKQGSRSSELTTSAKQISRNRGTGVQRQGSIYQYKRVSKDKVNERTVTLDVRHMNNNVRKRKISLSKTKHSHKQEFQPAAGPSSGIDTFRERSVPLVPPRKISITRGSSLSEQLDGRNTIAQTLSVLTEMPTPLEQTVPLPSSPDHLDPPAPTSAIIPPRPPPVYDNVPQCSCFCMPCVGRFRPRAHSGTCSAIETNQNRSTAQRSSTGQYRPKYRISTYFPGKRSKSLDTAPISRSSTFPLMGKAYPALSRPQSHEFTVIPGAEMVESPVMSPMMDRERYCQSPVSDRSANQEVRTGQVVSISTTTDAQIAIQDTKGMSMTAVLVEILRKDPHPAYRNLLTEISHRLLHTAESMHNYFKTRKAEQDKEKSNPNPRKSLKRRTGSLGEEMMDALQNLVLNEQPIQEPMIGSQIPLNMDKDRFMDRPI